MPRTSLILAFKTSLILLIEIIQYAIATRTIESTINREVRAGISVHFVRIVVSKIETKTIFLTYIALVTIFSINTRGFCQVELLTVSLRR